MAEEIKDRFQLLYEESKKFSAAVELPDDLILKIYQADTDWEFILKVDALLEMASKAIIKKALESNKLIASGTLEAFVDALPINGRTSLLALLKGTPYPEDAIELIDCVRRLRNGFAHDIKQVDLPLVEVIKARNDKSYLLRGLCAIKQYDEDELVKAYERDGGFLRYGIIDSTLRFIVIAYQQVLK